MDGARGGEEACVVVLRRGERRVYIKEGQRLVCWGVEAELGLAHLQLDGGGRGRGVVALFPRRPLGGRGLENWAPRGANALRLLVGLPFAPGQTAPGGCCWRWFPPR